MLSRRSAPRCAAGLASPRAPARCHCRQGCSTACRAPRKWVLPERGRVLHLVPTPWPWLSSVPLVRYGATLQPRPSRRSSAHASTDERSRRSRRLRAAPAEMSTPAVNITEIRSRTSRNLSQNGYGCCCCCFVDFRL